MVKPAKAKSGIGQFNCPVCGKRGVCGKVGTVLPVAVLLVFLAVIVGVPGYCGLLESFLLLELEDDSVLGVLGVAGLDGVFWLGYAFIDRLPINLVVRPGRRIDLLISRSAGCFHYFS